MRFKVYQIGQNATGYELEVGITGTDTWYYRLDVAYF